MRDSSWEREHLFLIVNKVLICESMVVQADRPIDGRSRVTPRVLRARIVA